MSVWARARTRAGVGNYDYTRVCASENESMLRRNAIDQGECGRRVEHTSDTSGVHHPQIAWRFGHAFDNAVPVNWNMYASDTLPVTLVSSGIRRVRRTRLLCKIKLPALVRFEKVNDSSPIIV